MEKEVLIAIIGGTVAVTTTIVTGIFKLLEIRKRKTEEKNKIQPITQIQLFEKDLFSKADYLVNYAVKRMGFEQGDRSWIYETIMTIKIQTIVSKTKLFIEKNDLNSINNTRFENMVFALISEIIDEYNSLIKESFVSKFGKSKGSKIFDLVMDKQPTKESQSLGFNVWHASTITYMEKTIKDYCHSYYPNNVERMDDILDLFKCAISAAHTHLYKTFGNFNGELDYLLLI